MRQLQLDQRGEIIRHLPCQVIFSLSPAQILNLAEPIIRNDALLAVLSLNHDPFCQSAHLLGVWTRHYAGSRAS